MNKLHTALKHLHLRPVAYYPVYAKIMGSVAGGVVLSQLLYWAARSEGEFYKTNEDLAAETGCSLEEVKAVKRRLKELPFVHVEVRGIPARTYYRVDWQALVEAVASASMVDSVQEDHEEADEAENPPTSRVGIHQQVGWESTNKSGGNPPTSWGKFHQLVGGNSTNLLVGIPPTITETTTETTTENIVQSSTGADAPASEGSSPTGKGKKPRPLTLRIEAPAKPKKEKPDYYREVARAFREVVGDASDSLAIRACLSAWKQVREGGEGVRGLSAEEIVSLWKRARERASEERRPHITLLWVLNNGERARWLASYEPPPDPNRVIDETPEVLRIIAERRKLWQEEGESCLI